MSAIRPSSALFALMLAACSSPSTPKPAPAADTVTIADSGADVTVDMAAEVSATEVSSAEVSAPTWTATHSAEHAVSLFYSQGVARVPDGWIFSASGGLWRTDEQFNELVARELPLPATLTALGFNHIGDIDVAAGLLYAALEQPNTGLNQQAVARFDPKTLQYVDHVLLPQHEASFLSVDEPTMIAYLCDHYSDDTMLRYDVAAGWKPLSPLPMSRKVEHIQGADVALGALWLSAEDEVHGIYRVDLVSGEVVQVGSVGRLVKTGIFVPEVEGIDATPLPTGLLHILTGEPLHATSWLDDFTVKAP